MTVINNASELYREIKKKGFELRKNKNARDNNLYFQLCKELKCDEASTLQSHLENENISINKFLEAFLRIAEPFSAMYREIWDYLIKNSTPNALESITINFGNNIIEDLKAFEKNIELINATKNRIENRSSFTEEAVKKLFCSKLTFNSTTHHKYGKSTSYSKGNDYSSPDLIVSTNHPLDIKINLVRDLIIDTIDQNKVRYRQTTNKNNFLDYMSHAICDLIPKWYNNFQNYKDLNIEEKDDFLQYWNKEIEPLMLSDFNELSLKIIDLPFWHQRWHTYEIWSTILILKTLKKYNLNLNKIKNRLPIDGNKKEMIATLEVTLANISPVIWARYQTSFEKYKRKAINPDIRITYGKKKKEIKEDTACIIEFKQRKNIAKKHIENVALYYKEGSPNCKGVIITNFDKVDFQVILPSNTFFFDDLNPLNNFQLGNFEKKLIEILEMSELTPRYTQNNSISDFIRTIE